MSLKQPHHQHLFVTTDDNEQIFVEVCVVDPYLGACAMARVSHLSNSLQESEHIFSSGGSGWFILG